MSNETQTAETAAPSSTPATAAPAAPATSTPPAAAAPATSTPPAAAPAAQPAAPESSTLLGNAAAPAAAAQAEPAKPDAALAAAPAAQAAAPEAVSYDDLQAPEGTQFNPESLGEFKTLATEMKLPKEQAQKLADLGVKAIQRQQEQFMQAVAAEHARWEEAARTDPEYGGDKLDESLGLANRALAEFASPEMLKLLKDNKLGNHPEIIRTFVRVGRAINEDKLVTGSTKPAVRDARNFYPNSNHTA
ncbi:hypothetical protein G3T20_05355 [Bordetella hinzii]|uniref:hypothetical protein n=1 Tax=Bordetella hinzii TaxID=103855 RepID=UPI0013EFFB2D|nr:hypothetical protein [Bordetella hinzii]QII84179.1 hypothetical protein G3T20_05355 [Bordetella hinzii]